MKANDRKSKDMKMVVQEKKMEKLMKAKTNLKNQKEDFKEKCKELNQKFK